MARAGGTLTWCPTCERDTICSAKPNLSVGSRVYRAGTLTDTTVYVRSRSRLCLRCSHQFYTHEVRAKVLEQLIKERSTASKKIAALKAQLTKLRNRRGHNRASVVDMVVALKQVNSAAEKLLAANKKMKAEVEQKVGQSNDVGL
jgi:hypothetical protein